MTATAKNRRVELFAPVVTSQSYPWLLGGLANGTIDLRRDVFKCALFAPTFVADPRHRYMSEINAHEINAVGYEGGFDGSGRQTLTNQALVGDLVDGWFTADKIVFPPLDQALTRITQAVVYQHQSSDADSVLIVAITFGHGLRANGGPLEVHWSPGGIVGWSLLGDRGVRKFTRS